MITIAVEIKFMSKTSAFLISTQ